MVDLRQAANYILWDLSMNSHCHKKLGKYLTVIKNWVGKCENRQFSLRVLQQQYRQYNETHDRSFMQLQGKSENQSSWQAPG